MAKYKVSFDPVNASVVEVEAKDEMQAKHRAYTKWQSDIGWPEITQVEVQPQQEKEE